VIANINNRLVSVIVPTYNSGKTIENCLVSIQMQSHEQIEIIVVDRYSTDNTLTLASQFGAVVIQENCERARAKNIGLKQAKGDYVLFVDADMELSRDVITACVDCCKSDESIGGVVIPERSIGDGYWARVRDFERSFYAGTKVESARFFPRQTAIEANGFDEDVIFFEESTLPQKIHLRGKIVDKRIDTELYHFEGDFDLLVWLRKKLYYVKTARVYKHRYPELYGMQTSVSNRAKVFVKTQGFFSKPTLALGVILIKTVELTVTWYGYFIVGFGISSEVMQ